MFSLLSQISQLGICLLQGRYFLLLSPECGMKLQRETHDYYSLTHLVKYVSTGMETWDNVIHDDLVKHVPSKQNELIQFANLNKWRIIIMLMHFHKKPFISWHAAESE